ncbi:MAG: preprotein translocase subunit SecG [bacterium]
MFTVLVILIILLCIILTLVVLAQAAKGNGLAGGLAAPGSVGTMFGVRRASDFLMKATIVIAGVFVLFTIVANRFFLPTSGSAIVNPIREGGRPPVTAPPAQRQAAPAQPSAPAAK